MTDPSNLVSALESELEALERELPQLQLRHRTMFAFANAWAEQHDALLARTPDALKPEMQARLLRIGIRWGLMPGTRMTAQFPALPPLKRILGR